MVRRSLSPELHEEILNQSANPTKAESLLWDALRKHKLDGCKFRRQHPALGYILDFYCSEVKLGIELDGNVHRDPNQRTYDTQRTDDLAELGIKLIRFWNFEVEKNLQGVLHRIMIEVMDRRNNW